MNRIVAHNKAAVAVANKLARIVWAVWYHQRSFALIARPPEASTSRIAPLTQELPGRKERDGETGRTGAGKADNNCALRGRCHRLSSRRADSVMARSPRGLRPFRPRVRTSTATSL